MTENPVDWLNLAERLGIPTLFILLGGLGFWKIVNWIGKQVEKFAENIVKPIADAHLHFVGSLDSTQKQLANSSQKQADAVDKISDTLETITVKHGQKLEDIHSAIVLRKGGPS